MNRKILKMLGATFAAVITLIAIVFTVPTGAIENLNGTYSVYCGVYCTQTQGGWGQDSCSGGNVACLRDAHFNTVYPTDLVVGGTNTLTFNNASDVAAYLPAGGTPASLITNHTNPTTTESGVFGGQVTALRLNRDFSASGFGKVGLPCPLGELTIADTEDPFYGWTVNDFLDMAEDVLGGDSPPSGITISDVNDTATAINENYVDCTTDNGFLE